MKGDRVPCCWAPRGKTGQQLHAPGCRYPVKLQRRKQHGVGLFPLDPPKVRP